MIDWLMQKFEFIKTERDAKFLLVFIAAVFFLLAIVLFTKNSVNLENSMEKEHYAPPADWEAQQ